MSLTQFFFLLLLLPISSQAACNAPPSKLDLAYSQCDTMHTATLPEDIAQAIGGLQREGFCATPDLQRATTSPLKAICAEPGKFICSNKTGLFFNSQCQLEVVESKDIGELASYKNEECAFDQEKADFVQKHKAECGSAWRGKDCEDHLKVLYAADILKMERLHFYTPERVARMRAYFERAKQKFIELITTSSLVPEYQKPLLLSRIQGTNLFLDPNADKTPECMNAGVNPPGSEFYNDISRSIVVVCLGVMVNLERTNPQSLLLTMAHELSHSIDPCVLEATQMMALHPDPDLGKKAYPGLLQCLRGGQGTDGCQSSILNCNSPKGIAEAIAAFKKTAIKDSPSQFSTPALRDQLEQDIKMQLVATPDCSHGKSDPNAESMNAADFRKDPEPVEQIGESFADFMGAEIAGRITAEDAARGTFNAKDGVDALVATASSFAQLHGGCRQENTHDEHPIGILRINRNIMSNQIYREAMGCWNGPPLSKGAGTTCKGL